MSSSAIYGIPESVPINSKTKLKPLEIYGRSKKKADDYITGLISHGKPISTIRPRTIVGKERLGIFEILFEWIHDQANIFIIGKGDGLVQFVHIDDLVENITTVTPSGTIMSRRLPGSGAGPSPDRFLMGCEGDADRDLYKKLLSEGAKQLI